MGLDCWIKTILVSVKAFALVFACCGSFVAGASDFVSFSDSRYIGKTNFDISEPDGFMAMTVHQEAVHFRNGTYFMEMNIPEGIIEVSFDRLVEADNDQTKFFIKLDGQHILSPDGRNGSGGGVVPTRINLDPAKSHKLEIRFVVVQKRLSVNHVILRNLRIKNDPTRPFIDGMAAAEMFPVTFEKGQVPGAVANIDGWEIDSTFSSEGSSSFVSPRIGDEERSAFILSIPKGVGYVEFDYFVSSEDHSDYLALTVNGEFVTGFSGTRQTEFKTYRVDVDPRQMHVFEFVYSKSFAGSAGHDRAWLDNFRIGPPVESPGAYQLSSFDDWGAGLGLRFDDQRSWAVKPVGPFKQLSLVSDVARSRSDIDNQVRIPIPEKATHVSFDVEMKTDKHDCRLDFLVYAGRRSTPLLQLCQDMQPGLRMRVPLTKADQDAGFLVFSYQWEGASYVLEPDFVSIDNILFESIQGERE
ncbi:MAG: hypothetical protein CL675_08750 [Bdellovibrionaceae bacterium]|nr:hypothetical protein [Pseudobdellovibrionaceae bacterium]